MSPFLEIWHAYLTLLLGSSQGYEFIHKLIPMVLFLELPLYFLMFMGLLRWFTRKVSRLPYKQPYRPRVSCIILCYSEGKAIHGTLKSLCEQLYNGHIELIPVIDGAVDNKETYQAVRNFSSQMTLYSKRKLTILPKWQRGGRVSSENAGLNIASGEIVMVLDGDTSFDNNMVANAVRHFRDPKISAVAGTLKVRNSRKSLVTRLQALEYLISIHAGKVGLAEWNIINNISGAFGIFRRDFIRQIGGWDTHTAEDLDLTLRIKSYFKREHIHIPFDPDAIGHTDVPDTWVSFFQQRLRWDGDLGFLYFRKHSKCFSPRLMGWRNFVALIWYGLLFQIVLPFLTVGYLFLLILLSPVVTSISIILFVYTVYFFITSTMYIAALLMVSERIIEDLKLIWLLPLFPLFALSMRCWSAVALLNEALRRGHEETAMAPWWVLKKAERF